MRYLVLVLVILRLRQLGAGRTFAAAALVVGFASAAGTIMMTATPFSVSPVIHKTGIGFYFFGVVVLQSLGARQSSSSGSPSSPTWSGCSPTASCWANPARTRGQAWQAAQRPHRSIA